MPAAVTVTVTVARRRPLWAARQHVRAQRRRKPPRVPAGGRAKSPGPGDRRAGLRLGRAGSGSRSESRSDSWQPETRSPGRVAPRAAPGFKVSSRLDLGPGRVWLTSATGIGPWCHVQVLVPGARGPRPPGSASGLRVSVSRGGPAAAAPSHWHRLQRRQLGDHDSSHASAESPPRLRPAARAPGRAVGRRADSESESRQSRGPAKCIITVSEKKITAMKIPVRALLCIYLTESVMHVFSTTPCNWKV